MTIIALALTLFYSREMLEKVLMHGAETSRIFIVYLYLI